MLTLILSVLLTLLIVAAMAIGVIMGRKPISGSCGGIAALGLDGKCEICGGNPNKCDKEQIDTGAAKTKAKADFYDATK